MVIMVIKTAYPWQHFGSIKNPPEVNGGWAVRPGEVLLLETFSVGYNL